jgi:hypothetical protein
MRKAESAQLWTVVKASLSGMLVIEAWLFAKAFRPVLISMIEKNHAECLALLCGLGGFAIVAAFEVNRGGFSLAVLVAKSKRVDLYLSFLAGIYLSTVLASATETAYAEWVGRIPRVLVLPLLALPFVFMIGNLLGRLIGVLRTRAPKKDAFFLNDSALDDPTADLLDVSIEADRFAERVANLGSPESMSFGIDAPWGIGKSSFVNFCQCYWGRHYPEKIVIFKFHPLEHEGRSNLLEVFVDGLVRIIQQHAFLPEARPLLFRYSRFIKGAKTSFFGLDFEFLPGTYSVDEALSDLKTVLNTFDKQIVVVVDDLDRLSLAAIKEVLFAIKRAFTLPRISYVLCYDTQNIGSVQEQKQDAERIIEFLEKFINVKVSLYLNAAVLSKYVTEKLSIALSGNSLADPGLISTAMGGLIEIFKSKKYYQYQSFVGDIRKIKRLINTLLLLQIETTDFENSDFNNADLIHLLLIYINYPHIFRDIYNSEGDQRGALFSVLGPHDEGYPEPESNSNSGAQPYKNSDAYYIYVKKLGERQRFLVDKVFSAADRLRNAIEVDQEKRHSYACFNGSLGTGSNLRHYLQLIVKLAKPQKSEQYRFYLNCKNKIAKGEAVTAVLSTYEFAVTNGEASHEQLWRVVVNSARDFDYEVGTKLIRDLLELISMYSAIEDGGNEVGLRNRLPVYLVKLLDTAGWADEGGRLRNNSDENVQEIAEWILGEGRHAGSGVIDVLLRKDRGVLGLYDSLVFRLYCSADRGGDSFNLQRALAKHGDQNAPTEGLTTTIAIEEMRELSQLVFRVFKNQYITSRQNVFTRIDALTFREIVGEFDSTASAMKNIEESLAKLKAKLKVFITYQLGSARVSMGVPCGYYDEIGKSDQSGIAAKINDYLFSICFESDPSEIGYLSFVDYLLLNFSTATRSSEDRDFGVVISEWTMVLSRGRLAQYWREHREAIRGLNLSVLDKEIVTLNFRASYNKDLGAVFSYLDRLAEQGD